MKENGRDANTFNWEGFQNKFFGEGSWQEAIHHPPGNLPWVESYIRDLLSDALPVSYSKPSISSQVKSATFNIFETHHMILVKIKLLQNVTPQSVKFFLGGANELLIKGLPDEEEHKMNLPSNVRHSGSKVVYKNGVFEVRMPKEEGVSFKEIPTRYL
jgi:hypothetical protein